MLKRGLGTTEYRKIIKIKRETTYIVLCVRSMSFQLENSPCGAPLFFNSAIRRLGGITSAIAIPPQNTTDDYGTTMTATTTACYPVVRCVGYHFGCFVKTQTRHIQQRNNHQTTNIVYEQQNHKKKHTFVKLITTC